MITIIPAIDIIEGTCVRLTRGEFQSKKIYNVDPLEVAKEYEDIGIKRLHMVDLDGAKQRHIVNWKVLERIALNTTLDIDFGGGVQSHEDIEIAFQSGANQVTAGSVAILNPKIVQLWLEKYGAEKIILGADVKNGKVAIHAWQKQTDNKLLSFLSNYYKSGIRYVICTDISQDGLLQGPSVDLYDKIKNCFPDFYLIASGGISCVEDITMLGQINIDGVIIGKALYEGKIKLMELKPFLC